MIDPSVSTSVGSLLDKAKTHLRKMLSSVTGGPLQGIDANAPIEILGVKAILQMTNELEKSLGWLPKTLYFEYPTLAALAQYMVESHPEKLSSLLGGNIAEGTPNETCQKSVKAGAGTDGLTQTDFRQQERGEKIAIIGLSCRFPHARNMHDFWANLRDGRDCIEEIPPSRWDYRFYFDDEERNKLGKTNSKWGGFVEGFDEFDPSFFSISPREAELMDPQERIFLECVYSAVEDAGYTPGTLCRSGAAGIEQSVGVYVGIMFQEYPFFRGDLMGSRGSIANRTSYYFDFSGPSMAVDTMCSSSLTAIHLACQSLKREECSVAIAGGVNLSLHPSKYLMTSRLRLQSPKGRCKAFGQDGDGFVHGEGVGTVILKSLSDALADGDNIYGVIQATAINQCGKTRNYLAPSPRAQAAVIGRALEIAGINPRIISYVEAHGTGTSLGDPIEVAGLTKAFIKHSEDKQYCAIGSVKSNIGHCEGAAGIAGLTKVLLQMKHRQLAPSLHSEQLNPNIKFVETPFVVQQKLEEWKRPQMEVDGSLREYSRIAGISSFGGGGANAHVVVEEFIAERSNKRAEGKREGRVAVVLSARNEERLRERAQQLLDALVQGQLEKEALWDMAYTLQIGREGMEHRLGMTAGTMEEVREKLTQYLNGVDEIDEFYHGEVNSSRDMAKAFSGDEDLTRALENCLKKGKWAKLLEVWTKGVAIDWSQLYLEGEKPRRISLPTYPFARERYWAERIDGGLEERGLGRDVLHPLVQRNTSMLGEQSYSTTFTGGEFYLRDHRVGGVGGGERVLPGVAYLEMVRAGVEQAWPRRPEGRVLELRQTVWARPVVVRESKEVHIHLWVNEREEMEYEISSEEAGEEIVHCQGCGVWSEAGVAVRLDLEHLKAEMSEGRVEPEKVYAGLVGMGVVHGPGMQALAGIERGRDQVLAQLRLPRVVEESWGEYGLHPSLMDGALQAAGGVMEGGPEFLQQTRLPYALESLRIVGASTREMMAWVRYAPGSGAGDAVVKLDIDLCDAGGMVCVEMRGFSTRVVKSEEGIGLLAGQEVQSGLQRMVPVWNPAGRERQRPGKIADSASVLLLGGDAKRLEWVQQSHANAYGLPLASSSTTERIQEQLQACGFEHLLWIAPDVATTESGCGTAEDRVIEDQVIEQQEVGVLEVFRIVKALLALGYGERELRWTIITGRTQRVKKSERVQATHAAIFGLVGSLAKEYPHWELSLLDVESLASVSAQQCLAMAPDKQGNGLARRGGEWFYQEFAQLAKLPVSSAKHYRKNGVYVVIGGAGGLGEVWTRYMMEHYQARVVWIGRSKYDAALEAKIQALAKLGEAPLYITADATKLEELEQTYKTIREKYSVIHGVVHSAIVLQDQSLAGMEESGFRASLAAKVDISVNLDRVFGGQELDFMLFFSSLMSFVKAAGQSNYAAGCTFKDSFAHKLEQERGYAVKIVNWGYWGQVGVVAEESYQQSMARVGIGSIEPEEGMECLQALMDSELNQMGVIKMIDAQTLVPITERVTYYPAAEKSGDGQGPRNLMAKVSSPPRAALEEGEQSAEMEAVLGEMLASTLKSMGLLQRGMGRIADLWLEQAPAAFYERWLESSIGYLQERKWLSADLMFNPEVRELAEVWQEWEEQKTAWTKNPNVRAQIALLEVCLRALPEILRGQQRATDVMFPDASMELVEGIYRGHGVADYFNEVLGESLSCGLEEKREAEPKHKIRILEIGAGTGGTTAKLLPRLERFAVEEYCYTDVSRAFLLYGEEHYGPRLAGLRTALFDVARPLAGQGIAANHYDVVIATNVLHATPNIRETLRHAKAALKNHGLLLLNEISVWSLFAHLTFGLLEGWWLHEDTGLRLAGSPGLAPERWREILAEEGFESIVFPAEAAHGLGQQIIVSRSDGWGRQGLGAAPVKVVEPRPPASAMPKPAVEKKGTADAEESLREKAVAYFQKLVGATLKMRPEQIVPRRPLAEYGLDSILVGQLTYQLRQAFTEVTGTLFFEVQSLDGLVDYFLENKKPELVAVLSQSAASAPPLSQSAVGARTSAPPVAHRQRTGPRSSARRRMAAERSPSAAILPQPAASMSGSTAVSSSIFDVAIIGLSGRYPQARNLEEFWSNLSQGINCITEIPRERWSWETYYDPEKGKPGKIYTKWGGFLEGIDQFDPLFFKISPKEAKRMDPQERIFLQACYHAIEDAGYTPEQLGKPEKIGVFVGVMNSRYTPQPAHSSIANRVSYLFNFQGPSMAVDTACSSSLTALHVALESLYSGGSACALAGGVNLIIDPVHYLQLTEMTMLSSGNQCKAFGEQADGLVDAEGVGVVVLKPLSQAQQDGDHIYGVIKGSAINAGGRTNGYTVPNPQAQSRLVAQALERAGIAAEQVSYVEAHGTGTALGDPIEIAGLTRAFKASSERKQFCALGSLKSNIGHCESAAGIAGLTKVLLQMQHEQLVPSLHSEIPNPEIDFAQTPFKVQKSLEKWQRPVREENGVMRELRRVAGVSSFGAGGSNAHVIVEEYEAGAEESGEAEAGEGVGGVEEGKVLVVMSARTGEQLGEKARELKELVGGSGSEIDVRRMAYTLQVGREGMEERLGLLVGTVEELGEKLGAYVGGEEGIEGAYRGQVKGNQETLSLFRTDADLRQTVEKWLAGGKLSKLGEMWVKGLEVDWSKLYGEKKPRRMSLPGYPFARERYWIERGAEEKSGERPGATPAAALLHPLLHRNTSDLEQQRYSTTFTGEEFFLKDNPVDGQRNLPEAGYLEMARAAVERAACPGKEMQVQLRDVIWGEPVVVQRPKEVSITVWATESEEMGFEIYSEESGREIVHGQGKAVLEEKAAPGTLDIGKLKEQIGASGLQPASVNASLIPGQAVREVYAGKQQWLLRLGLPAEDQSGEYVLHPRLVQDVLQASVVLMVFSDAVALRRPLLSGLESLRIASGCTKEMWAWVRYAAGSKKEDAVVKLDIDLCDERGHVCVQMRGASGQVGSRDGVEAEIEEAAFAAASAAVQQPKVQVRLGRKEIKLFANPPAVAVGVEGKKRAAISLVAPSVAGSAITSSRPGVRLSSARASIALSPATLGVPIGAGTAAAAAEAWVRLFDRGNGIFSIEMMEVESPLRVQETILQWLQALDKVRQEESLKVVLLRGMERCFGGRGREDYNEAVEQGLYAALVSFPYPVIAVLRGDVKGAGFLMAAVCDFMVGNEEAKYGYTNGARGFYATPGEVELLSERFGRGQAEDFLYRPETVTGQQLRSRGWTFSLVAGEEVEVYAEGLAARLAEKPQMALGLLKQHGARKLAGLVQGLMWVEVGAKEDDVVVAPPIAWPGGHIQVEVAVENVVVMKFRIADKKVLREEVMEELGRIFTEVKWAGGYKAIVLVSESAEFIPGVEGDKAEEEVVRDFQRLVMELEIPVVAAMVGNGKGNGWLLSQMCDGCVYSRKGKYSAAGLSREAGAMAAAIFLDRLGKAAGQEILLTEGEYTGMELQRRVGALLVVEAEEVVARAVEVAGQWSGLPRATLAAWKKHSATRLWEKMGSLAASGGWEQEEEESGEPLTKTPGSITLQSKVVTAMAYPEGIVVVKMEDRQAKNMFSPALLAGVEEIFAHIEKTRGYKVVILTGYDSYFACGGTKESLLAIQAGKAKFTDAKGLEAALKCKLPVIAAMQGHGIGAGWTLGMLADVVLLSEESRYVSPYMNYGFTPGAGATWVLAETLGQDLARESLLSGQPYTGRELQQRGLRLGIWPRSEMNEAAMRLARQIARGSRSRLRRLKRQFTAQVPERLEETYRRELAMHEKTFVGQSETLAQIQQKFYQEMEVSAAVAEVPVEVARPNRWADSEVLPAVTASLKQLLADELQMRDSDIDEQVQLVDVGLDSISGVTWVRKINEKYHTSIEATKVYSYPTLAQMSRYVKEEAEKQGTLASPAVEAVGMVASPSTSQSSAAQGSVAKRGAAKFSGEKLGSRRRRGGARLRSSAVAATVAAERAIAVIGMAGQFPQAKNLEEFWQNIAQGRNCITPVSSERWDVKTYYQPGAAVAGKTNSQWVGALADYDRFDPLFFNISPTEAESMDPQQRLFLQACWHSIENAGYDGRALSGSKCGVFVGCAAGHYQQLSRQQQLSAQGFTGNATSILAARISYFLNLQGPCLSIDTACSSSLVALAHACDSLTTGNSDLALAGGVYVMAGADLHIMTAQAGMLSPEGQCYSFDERANGFVPGEGVGVVLLKRLAEAEKDQDIIYGVIEGWGVNQDGKTNGITAPNPESQTRLEREVYDKYQIDPGSIQLIEAHGTGTKLGDPIEVEGLKKAFQAYTQKQQYCALGSVKSNIGHCATAAGIAGFLKLVLALQHQQLPPSINFERLNEHIELEGSPFYVNSRLQPWELQGGRRQAAVSSFGFSGTNAHMVIGEYVAPVVEHSAAVTVAGPQAKVMVPLSARTAGQLKQKACDLRDFVRGKEATVDLLSMAYTLQVGREGMEERLVLVVSSVEQLAGQLEAYIEGKPEGQDFHQGSAKRSPESLNLLNLDEEVKEAMVSKWLAGGKLSKLGEMWVKGLEVDWSKLYGEKKPRRMSLPGYPFARERYWIERGAEEKSGERPGATPAAALLHPLLHRNTSDLEQQRYSTTFTGEEFFLRDHLVALAGGKVEKVLPGVAYLEMARAAIEQAMPTRPPTAILELHNTVWAQPIVGSGSTPISIALFAQGNNSKDDGEIEYEIYSQEGEQEIVHGQGRAVWSSQSGPAKLDVEQLKRQMGGEKLEPGNIYAAYTGMGLRYGGSLQAIVAVHRGSDQVLAQLRLPQAVEKTWGSYVLHPSLMDGGLQASMGMMEGRMEGGPQPPRLPFALDELRIVGPCTKQMWAWVRYAEGSKKEDAVVKLDIDLCDERGHVCVQMRGFSSRVLEPSVEVLAPADQAVGSVVATPAWEARSVEALTGAGQIEYAKQHVILCELAQVKAEKLEALLGQSECVGLPAEEGKNIAERYSAYAVACLERMQAILQGKPQGKVLVQMVVGSGGEQALLAGLSGLLKTAGLENPQIVGQLILAAPETTSEELADRLGEEKGAGVDRVSQEPLVRYEAGGGRQVLVWQEIEEQKDQAPKVWREQGVYLITGGLGALGMLFAQEILERTEKARVVLTGRMALSVERQARLERLRGTGAGRVSYRQVDLGNDEEVKGLIATIQQEYGQLNGIVHSAGMIADNFIGNKRVEEFREVLEPKVSGTYHLDEASREVELDFFVLFSSIAGAMGNVGQADYAAANGYLDQFAAYRNGEVEKKRRHGRTRSINWGLWQAGGMATDDATRELLRQTTGMQPMQTATGLKAFYHSLTSPHPQMLVVEGDLPKIRCALCSCAVARTKPPKEQGAAEIDSGTIVERTQNYLRGQFSELLQLPAHRIDPLAALENYGIDSILAMKLTNRLEATFGSLSKTLFFEYQTIAGLAGYFVKAHPAILRETIGLLHRESETIDPDRTGIEKRQPIPAIRRKVRFLSSKPNQQKDIAIIGLAGRYPQAENLQDFWRNLQNGRDCITEIPLERWDNQPFYDPDYKIGKTYSRWGGFLADVDKFDPLFFNISPKEAELIDPQERLFLETAWEAIEDAGYSKKSISGKRVGVYAGVMWGHYELFGVESILMGNTALPHSSRASIANRVSYFFDFHGPSIALDTMCSSSLTAIHLACEELRKGEIDAAIAGGVNLTIHPYKYLSLSQGRFVATDGKCRSFGKGGDGYVPGEGVGAVLLKPLENALRDGDQVYAVIKSSSVNHGGKTNGYTVPNPNAQADLVLDALQKANINPQTLGYIETHGTGTSLGDPIEITGLLKAFEGFTGSKQFCPIGSVKSNIGHLESAAGIAAVTKALLQMGHEQLVPSLHADPLNPNIDFENSPFYVQTELTEWKRPLAHPRRAGVSSFGAGGANAHLILEEQIKDQVPTQSQGGPEVFILSARDQNTLCRYAERIIYFLETSSKVSLVNMAYTLQVGRTQMDARLAILASSVDDLRCKLNQWTTLAKNHHSTSTSSELAGVFQGNVKESHHIAGALIEGTAGNAFMAALFASGDFERIARLWVLGVEIDWSLMKRPSSPTRISLPTYPFAKERCWVTQRIPSSALIHESRTDTNVVAMSQGAENKRRMHYRSQWTLEGLAEPTQIRAATGPLLVLDTSNDLFLSMKKRLENASANDTLVLLKRGKPFAEIEPNTYVLDPEREEQFRQLIEHLQDKAELPGLVLHHVSDSSNLEIAEQLDCRLSNGIYALSFLCKGLMKKKHQAPLRIISVFSSAEDTTAPLEAALAGFFKTLSLENPRYLAKVVDIRGGAVEDRESALAEKTNLVWGEILDESWTTKEILYRSRLNAENRAYSRHRKELLPYDVADSTVSPLPVRGGGVYLITGGLGGLGLIFSEYLVKKLRAKLVLIGRRPPSTEQEKKLDQLRSLGAEILVLQADVSKLQDTEMVVREAKARFSQINGVIHAAGVNRDAFILNKTRQEIEAVLAPKIYGTIYLDLATRYENLDLFVLFSSVAGAMGNVGQSDYAYGNCFLDCFAEARESLRSEQKRSGRTLSIDWPLWEEGGMTISRENIALLEKRTGICPLPTQDGIRYWEDFLQSELVQGVAIFGIPSKIADYMGPMSVKSVSTASSPAEPVDAATLFAKTEAYLKDLIGTETKLAPERIGSADRLESFGIDSVMINRINVNLERDLGALPKTLLYEHETVRELAKFLLKESREALVALFGSTASEGNPEDMLTGIEPERIHGHSSTTEETHAIEPIAIVGIHGRFPHSASLKEYWENLKQGRDLIDLVPQDRWHYEDFYHPDPAAAAQGKIYCKWGGFLDDYDKFDPHFFNISPDEAKIIDPQERLFLQSVWSAIEDAGYTRDSLKKHFGKAKSADVGVFVGVTTNSYHLWAAEERSRGHNVFPSALPWSIANRVSYFFDFNGPSMPVDTACSSSLVAIHLACESLRNRECKVAIAGGVNLYLHPSKYQSLCQKHMLSLDGKCHSYGAGDDGFVPGEGVGSLVLKPLSKALEHRDRIYAIIAASAFDHSGRSNGYSAPNPNSQASLIGDTLKRAQIDAGTIGYVEGHGTGTQLGDSIEIAALTQAFQKQTTKKQFCSIGSVKANIGHSESAAGIAGVAKVILQIQHRQLVPSIHSDRENPNIEFQESPFYLQHGLDEWESSPDQPRRALINSFGAGGVNACLVLQEHRSTDLATNRSGAGPYLFPLSARNETRLRDYVDRLLTYLRSERDIDLADLCYTLQIGREAMEERLAVVVSEMNELIAHLTEWSKQGSPHVHRGSTGKSKRSFNRAMADMPEPSVSDIASLWVAGEEVRWEDLHSGHQPRRIALPTYPFARDRYWVSDSPIREKQNVSNHQLHPLISHNSSSLKEVSFSSTLWDTAFYAEDHKVNDERIFPGAGYLEMACISGNIAGELRVRKIKDIVWIQPLTFRTGSQTLRTSLKDVGDDVEYVISSLDDENEPILHAEGSLVFQNGWADPAEAEENVPVQGLKAQCANPESGPAFYDTFRKYGVHYGPSFQTVQEIYLNQSFALSKLKIADHLKNDFGQFILHPSMIDGAFQTAAGLVGGLLSATPQLPFSLDELDIVHPVRQTCYAYVELSDSSEQQAGVSKFNIRLLNESGDVLVRFKNLFFRALSKTHVSPRFPVSALALANSA